MNSSLEKKQVSRSSYIPLKWIIWGLSFIYVVTMLFRAMIHRDPQKPMVGPIVMTELAEGNELTVNQPVKLEAASEHYFIFRNSSTGELVSSVEEKDRTKFPVPWNKETYHSVLKEKLEGKWILVEGNDVRVRIIGTPRLIVGPQKIVRPPVFGMLVLFVCLVLLWFFLALLLSEM